MRNKTRDENSNYDYLIDRISTLERYIDRLTSTVNSMVQQYFKITTKSKFNVGDKVEFKMLDDRDFSMIYREGTIINVYTKNTVSDSDRIEDYYYVYDIKYVENDYKKEVYGILEHNIQKTH